MRKIILNLGILELGFILFICNLCFAGTGGWFKINKGQLDADLYSISISPQDKNIVYCTSDKAIFRSLDGGITWKQVFLISGSNNKTSYVLADPDNKNIVYVGLGTGAFKSEDKGENFSNIYKSSSDADGVNFITNGPDGKLYLSTNKGLYVSDYKSQVFRRIGSLPLETKVYQLVFSCDLKDIYAVVDSGIYKSGDGANTFERIFTNFSKATDDTGITEEDSSDTQFLGSDENSVTTLLTDRFNPRNIYLGTRGGLFISRNAGLSFNRLMLPEFGRVQIRWLFNDTKDKNIIFVLTNVGFFEINLKNKQARIIYDGLSTNNLRFCAQDMYGKILLVTDKGLYERRMFDIEEASKPALNESRSSKEPGYKEIQAAALRYNEISPEKIAAWRNSLKMRALFPELQLDYDKTVTTALGATYDRTQVGPRDWGMSLSWDIADLVWNTYQDDIDNRSRLNTQLRIDILDEVNRLYFERKRLIRQLEEDPTLSGEELTKVNLRIEELTASLDGYTGGYFSAVSKLRGDK